MKSRLFLLAYACEPNQGGEHAVGWEIANQLVDKCNLVVVTRKSNKKLIEQHNNKNIIFEYIENDLMLGFKPPGQFSYMYYLFWQLSVYIYLRKKVTQKDIIHYITFGNLHLPHFLFLLKSKLIIGPMGGGSVLNPSLMKYPSLKEKLKYYLHKFVNVTVKINPFYYLLFLRSSKIILRTNETLSIIPKYYHEKCLVFLETGINKEEISSIKKNRKLKKIVTTGKIINGKNIDQVIEVFKQLKRNTQGLELLIAGDGPLKSTLIKQYSSVKNLKFLGKISQEEVKYLLSEADLFLFCSIKEGGSHSIFEAAMNNCPIACYDISGMKEFPKSSASIKIRPNLNIEQNINSLAKKINQSFKDEKINQICKNAIIDLKENYDWAKLGEKYMEIYKEIERGVK